MPNFIIDASSRPELTTFDGHERNGTLLFVKDNREDRQSLSKRGKDQNDPHDLRIYCGLFLDFRIPYGLFLAARKRQELDSEKCIVSESELLRRNAFAVKMNTFRVR
jgi:hypothetical protein